MMGDIRLSVKSFLANTATVSSSQRNPSRKENKYELKISADSTLSDVLKYINSDVLPKEKRYFFDSTRSEKGENKTNLTVYDCTLHPPFDITNMLNTYTDDSGPRSKTLQSMGFFPSGKLVLFETGDEITKKEILTYNAHFDDENVEYNKLDKAECSEVKDAKVILTGDLSKAGKNPLPSDLLNAVSNRFDTIETEKAPLENGALKLRQTRRTEKERCELLDKRLKELDAKCASSSKKKKNLSDQVKKMLIKSRAEGDKKRLRMEDRFHLETVLWLERGDGTGDELTSSKYKFYSRVENVGKVISSRTKETQVGQNQSAELLVSSSHVDDACIKPTIARLPNTMTLHDAESKGYVKEFCRVIIRVFDIGNESPEYLHKETNVSSSFENKKKKISDHLNSCIDEITYTDKNISNSVKQVASFSSPFLSKIVSSLDKKNTKKAKSSTSEKVRKMVLRGKAKGSKSIREEDRFYLEVILVDEEGNHMKLSSVQIIYISKHTRSERILSCITWPTDTENKCIEILIPDKDSIDATNESLQYLHLPLDIILNDAENIGYLKSYGRIILRRYLSEKKKP